MNFDPIFTSRPEQWPVEYDSSLPLNLIPAASGGRIVKLGCSFRNCELYVQVPMHWHEDRVNMLVARFRQLNGRG